MAETAFGFRIEAMADGWRWLTFGKDGDVVQSGLAPTKAMAAALIIRALTRDCIGLAA